jgi:hypothetical protein
MLSTQTIFILLLILAMFFLLNNKEHFSDCKKYKDNYDSCYKARDCTIMLDLAGNAFCTDR